MTAAAIPVRSPQPAAVLDHLLLLERGAIEAYTVALDRIKCNESRFRLRRMRRDHYRFAQDLEEVVHWWAQDGAHYRQARAGLYGEGRPALETADGDKAILEALLEQAKQLRDTSVAQLNQLQGGQVSTFLGRGVSDQERHCVWLAERLANLCVQPDRPCRNYVTSEDQYL